MRARSPLLAVFAGLGALYLGYPYAELYRLDAAIRHSDADTLRSMIDWHAVREGLKEDLCDLPADDPAATTQSSAELAPFGESFVRGITGGFLDKTVTPESLVSMNLAGQDARGAGTHVVWAFFHDPTRFLVDLRAKGSVEPIRMEMRLRDLRWTVYRVWLPNEMLERANSGT